eukprot:scaffold8155_cov111-Isochrysis_galbana.AAC.1
MPTLLTEHTLGEDCPAVLSFSLDEGAARLPLLSQLVHPLSPAAFVRRVYRLRVLATHGPASRFDPVAEHLHRLSLRKLLDDTPSEAIHVWVARHMGPSRGAAASDSEAAASTSHEDRERLPAALAAAAHGDAAVDGARGADSFKTEDSSAALTCYRAGASLYFRAPEDVSDLLVTSLSQQLGMSFGALHPDGAHRSEVETFASRAGHVTGWHFDFQHNFTLQLRGRKRWTLRPGTVHDPVRGCTPMWTNSDAVTRDAAEAQAKNHAQHATGGAFDPEPPRGGEEEVVMVPGSVLYVPAGVWHRVQAETDSLSINISVMGMSWADTVGAAVAQRLRAHPAARRPVSFFSVGEGREQVYQVLTVLRAEAAALTPADLLPACMPLPRALRVALPLVPAGGGGVDWLRRDTVYRKNPLAVLL